MNNPHGVEPTRYMGERNISGSYTSFGNYNYGGVYCNPSYGPIFGNNSSDINIADNCNRENSCWIGPSSRLKYECHPEYKSSLYVGTAGPDEVNRFSVSDYEVYQCVRRVQLY